MYVGPNISRRVREARLAKMAEYRATRARVLGRDAHRCVYCGAPATTVDHVVPRSVGGEDTDENLVAACVGCNKAKGDSSLAEFLARR